MKILRTTVYIILSIGICLNAAVAQTRTFLPSTSYWTRSDFLYLKSVHFKLKPSQPSYIDAREKRYKD